MNDWQTAAGTVLAICTVVNTLLIGSLRQRIVVIARQIQPRQEPGTPIRVKLAQGVVILDATGTPDALDDWTKR